MDEITVNKNQFERPMSQKIIRTSFLFLAWICLGLFLEITGPTLIDLKIRTGTDYNGISWAVAGSNIGFFVGSIAGGFLVDKFVAFCDLLLAIALTGAGLAIGSVPWTTEIQLMWFFIFLTGIFEGIIAVSGQKLILMMWRERSSSLLNLLHGGFGVGSFTIPLIANPFLALTRKLPGTNTSDAPVASNISNKLDLNAEIFHANGDSYTTEINNTTHKGAQENSPANSLYDLEFIKESRIEFAYLIAASIIIATSMLFYILHVIDVREMKAQKTTKRNSLGSKTHRPKRNIKAMINPATCANGRFMYGTAIFGGMFLFYINMVGGERVLGKFIRAYSIEQLNFSVYDGTYINTAFWISFTVGRFLGFIAARWIPIRALILIETGGVLLFSILLTIFGANSSLALWILLLALGLFHAPIFPSGVAWTNFHVEMTGIAICFLMLGGSLGGTAYLRFAGFLFETYGPVSFLYHVMGYAIISFMLIVILHFIGARHGSRFDRDESDISVISEEMNDFNESKSKSVNEELLKYDSNNMN